MIPHTHFNYSSTDQFRHVIKQIQMSAKYHKIEPPVITFTGTVKLHGTNCGVIYRDGEIFAQSRNNLIEDGHFGFAQWVADHNQVWKKWFESIISVDNKKPVVVYGEWCGQGVMKKVAISEVEKMFVVFAIYIIEDEVDEEGTNIKKPFYVCSKMDRIPISNAYLIEEFPTFKMDIDFSKPQLHQNDLVNLTLGVEAECPVGKQLGVSSLREVEFVYSSSLEEIPYKWLKDKIHKYNLIKGKKYTIEIS